MIVLWMPIAVALTLIFDPAFDPTVQEMAVFAIAIWGAYLIRTMFQSALGMICFWTTRGAAIFDLCMTIELLLSGRLVPLPLMPDWVQTLAWFFPFQWAFYFPIESLVGDLTTRELIGGLGMQLGVDPRRLRALHARLAAGDQALLGGGQLMRIAWAFLKVGVLNELQYRVNFVVQLFQTALALLTGLVVLALVYSHMDELNGWSEAELLVVLGIQMLMGGVIRAWIQPNMQRFIDDVREGTFDYALTKPEDSQVLVSVREFRIWQVVDVVTGAVVMAVGIGRLQSDVGLADAFAFGVALLLGTLMIYCFWLVLSTCAFWIVRMDNVVELFDGVYLTGRWPVGIYPDWLRFSITFLVPIAFAVTVPAEALTSRLDWQTLALAAGFAVVLFAITRWFWRFGLKRYSGASA